MRVLLDENMPMQLALRLRDGGHDVLAANKAMRGADDEAVLARARAEARLLLTQDKDFGELAFRCGLPAECGIVLFRLAGTNPGADVERMLAILTSRCDWAGHFAVVTDDRLRMRPLPPGREPLAPA